MRIITRSQWGAKPWTSTPYTATWAERTEVLVHYHGGPPKVAIGPGVPREVEAIHLANRWSGIGYNFLVDQAGNIYEGRGWGLVGAHCPNHNRSGIGIYVAVGGDQTPSNAALNSVVDLYEYANRQAGITLRKTYHGANYATACPGPKLIQWVKAGMPRPTSEQLPEMGDDLADAATIQAIADAVMSAGNIAKIADEINSNAEGAEGARYKVKRPDGSLCSITVALTEMWRRIAALEGTQPMPTIPIQATLNCPLAGCVVPKES